MRPAIDVRQLQKVYGGTTAVADVSFAVPAGAVLGVVGPNGSGKTTTVECIAGLRRPDGGSVRVHGLDPVTDGDAVRRIVGVQLQQAALPDRMRVAEAVQIFAGAYGRADGGDALLREWGLDGKRKAAFATLSGGQKQRLAIVLALLGDPQVVVLDELTTGLDPAARRDTWSLVRRLREQGTTVVLVTHDMAEVEALCDTVVVIVTGRVVAAGTPAEVTGEHRTLDAAYLALTDSVLQEA